MIVLTFTAFCILFRFQSSKSDTVVRNFDWEEANVRCNSQNDSLVTIQDIRSHRSITVGNFPIWSSVKGKFTPWIAYRGCYEGALCAGNRCKHLPHNTVGNCYSDCKSKNKDKGCANTDQFYFGLQKDLCKCFCDKNEPPHISESTNCNVSCGQDINNGECGGNIFYSMYEVTNVTLSHASFGGFCLTCQMKHGSIVLSSMECDAKANGYCVVSNNNITPMDTNMSTFDAYWNRCKMRKLYIVGNTVCQKRSMTFWTGLRKYDIESVRSNQTCYSIEKNETIIGYRERNCTESLPFICKHHTETDDHWTHITTIAAESSNCNPRPVTNDIVVITAASSSVIAATVVVFVVLYCGILRRRLHAKSHRHTDKRDIHLEDVTSRQCTSIDSNLQKVYHIIEPTTESNCNPEANHYYNRIKHLGQKN